MLKRKTAIQSLADLTAAIDRGVDLQARIERLQRELEIVRGVVLDAVPPHGSAVGRNGIVEVRAHAPRPVVKADALIQHFGADTLRKAGFLATETPAPDVVFRRTANV
jgi:hypothetical protein